MRELYLLSVWLHILAATVWVGGMGFLALVVVPWLRAQPSSAAGTFLRETGLRFRWVGWTCFSVVVLTGSFNLWIRGVRLGDLASAEWRASPFGISVLAKLGVFVVVLLISAVHDFSIGPRAADAMSRDPSAGEALRLRRQASVFGRINALLGLVLIGIAVLIVRGLP